MISAHLKPSVVKVITPFCRALLKMGITPNSMTITGTSMVIIGSVTLLAPGRLLAALIVIGLALLTDLLDGTMARISQHGPSKWGNFLDSTLDRVADAAVLLSLSYYLYTQENSLFIVAMITSAVSSLVPYARAKAESLGIECTGGFAERPERLIILGAAGAIYLLGVEIALAVGVWAVLLTSVLTVIQRMKLVWSATR
jgi:CDP-diacylglycerol---glycerol-3-phosphate 3-phosphatidyltransferase